MEISPFAKIALLIVMPADVDAKFTKLLAAVLMKPVIGVQPEPEQP